MQTLFPFKLLWDLLIRVLSLSTGEWRVGGMFGPFILCVGDMVSAIHWFMILMMIRYNGWGQLGQGHNYSVGDSSNEMGDALQDTDLGANFVATQLVAGEDHTCALSNDSRVKCWG